MLKLAEAELENPPSYSVRLRKLRGSFGNNKTTGNIPVNYPFISVSLNVKDRRRSALQRKRSSTVGIRRDSMTGAKGKAKAEMEAGVLNTEPVFVDVTPAGRYVCKWEGEVLTYPEISDSDMQTKALKIQVKEWAKCRCGADTVNAQHANYDNVGDIMVCKCRHQLASAQIDLRPFHDQEKGRKATLDLNLRGTGADEEWKNQMVHVEILVDKVKNEDLEIFKKKVGRGG